MERISMFVTLIVILALSTHAFGRYEDYYDGFNEKANSYPSSTLPLFRYYNKAYYMGIHFKARWFEAFQFCEALHMKLLTINSAAENSLIYKYIRDASKGNEYWLGGTRLVDGTNWVWMPYGTPIYYTNWSYGQPSDVDEKCLQVWIEDDELTWNDRDCDTKFFFICENYINPSYK